MHESNDNSPAMSSDEMYGLAKKMNRDLEQLPLHTHGAIIQLVNIAFEHRKLAMQRAEKEKQEAQQAKVIEFQERQTKILEERQRRADADALNIASLSPVAQ